MRCGKRVAFLRVIGTGWYNEPSGWLQETTGLTGTAAECVKALSACIRSGQERYMEQELNLLLPRDQIQDTRVTAVLYFLPTTKELSDRDGDIMAALGELVPTIPIMCKVCACCTRCVLLLGHLICRMLCMLASRQLD
jgi:hypothetical protein